MNTVRTFIGRLLTVFLICIVAGLNSSIKLKKELSSDFNNIDVSIKTIQLALFAELEDANNSITLLKLDDDNISKFRKDTVRIYSLANGTLNTNDIVKNTLIQRDLRELIDTSTKVVDRLVLQSSNRPTNVSYKDYEAIKTNLQELKESNKNLQELRNSTYDAIKDYNKKFNSISTTFLASLLGYHQIPVYIL